MGIRGVSKKRWVECGRGDRVGLGRMERGWAGGGRGQVGQCGVGRGSG